MEHELYKKHRPRIFKHVVGQREAVQTLEKLLENKKKFPHTILFTGPSGCGKTSLGYILKKKLSCGDADFTEVDCADFRGIEMVREIRTRVHLTPIAGKCRVWLIDECHMLTNEAQNAFLKLLEKTPKHVYFFLATTDPGKLKTTIKTRATEIKVSPLARLDMDHLIASVADKEHLKIDEDVVAKINECAEGSARKALVLLNQISELGSKKEQLRAIESSDSKRQAIEVARALISPQTSWDKMCQVLKGIDEEPEQLRYLILGYCSTIMLSNNKRMMSRANLIINVFRDNLYDSKRAGLIANCYEVITSKTR